MKDQYITAITAVGQNRSIFTRLSELFVREPDTDTGLGLHYIVDVIDACGGTDGAQVIQIVCQNHDIPVYDFRNHAEAPIRDIVKEVMETSPPRCAILLDLCDNALMQKVRTRLANKQCDLRYRRIVFCLTDQLMTPAPYASIQVPGNVQDRLAVLVYHIPESIRIQAASLDEFLPLATAMVDYALFRPRVWRDVRIDGTLREFLSTALYQVVRRVRSDPGVDDAYPTFEVEWRRSMATRLNSTLHQPPIALCPSIHSVIPIGVSSSDAMQAMQVAIPHDIEDPYAITVQSSAVDERCGSIAITQPMRYTVIHINCMINPGILVDVCRELRSGHKAVVAEVHAMNQKLSKMEEKHEETNLILATLVTRLSSNDKAITTSRTDDVPIQCSKTGCPHLVTTRFRSGKRQKQCTACQLHVVRTRTKRKSLLG
jgi:hypothetical protein